MHHTRLPSALAVLAGHGVLLWALMQLAPMVSSMPSAQTVVAWLNLSPPASVHTVTAAPALPLQRKKVDAAPATAKPPRPEPTAPTAAAVATELAERVEEVGTALAPSPAPSPAAPSTATTPESAPAMAPSTSAAPPGEPGLTLANHASCTAPPHPPALRERGIEGVVLLRVLVDVHGRANTVQLHASSGWRLFDEAALAQVRGCRFLPERRNGTAVESWVEFPMRFALSS